MDRLISEKAVLEAFREYQGSISDFYKAVKAIPPAEPKTDVLDKIRAEIAELQKEYKEYGWAYDDALEVIDKYMERSEE